MSSTSATQPGDEAGTEAAAPAAVLGGGGGLPRGVLILFGCAMAVITVAGIRAVHGIAGPAFLAVVLAIAAAPVRTLLADRGVPRWIGTTLSILVVYVGIVLLAGGMLLAAAKFATLVPEYQAQFAELVAQAGDLLRDLGVDSAQIQAILASFDLSRVVSVVTLVLSGTVSVATNLVFIVTLVLFVCLDAGSFGQYLESLRGEHSEFVEALSSFSRLTRTYLIVSTAFGLVVALIDTGLLYALGIPGALLWGLLAFITNYIPNIGFVLGLVPPAILGLLEGGPGLMLIVIVAYSAINVIIQSVIQPKLVGDAVGLSASITFLSLVVWAWILGPVGAVLAVPLTLLVRCIFVDVDPAARWFGGLIGTASSVPAATAPTADGSAGPGSEDVAGEAASAEPRP
ncbi:AI-2E family transporter [Nocardioides sp. GY 10127]|uniref:AI-2E family transporter n=1 Tax=Nocardioides sp. GY 10127 TaxID=2569762 RepID=UPI0010A7F072|nr:AI-2E family transporter [Nocardioides sp. GY 10127]TIC85647.1 AI-2E family transporter [Nocardioides sp. GY 10127]